MLIACLGGFVIPVPASAPDVSFLIAGHPSQKSVKELEQLARSIAVKIRGKDALGSGISIGKQGNVYTVVTNDHVLLGGNPPYSVETPDGKIHPAVKILTNSLKGNDLALLQFRSDNTDYAVAAFGSAPAIGEPVFAAGFPYAEATSQTAISVSEKQGFVFKTGRVSLVLDKPLQRGYRIGYTNDLEKGMSGGPLLNRRGEVVAINGMHAEPILDTAYVFQDGSQPSASLLEQMRRYSWGIPAETLVNLVRSPLANLNHLTIE
ncbi:MULTISPECIES: serine protease [unclassified Microcoleus]|uniref:S1 family peptidase n=1 Tax=unclassified Microcoleus TaxID=2642155 RepID=UPI0025D9B873|nr:MULTISPECIES: serine protease [unclassified Microcoleus]